MAELAKANDNSSPIPPSVCHFFRKGKKNMKTKELIEALQKEDPEGEMEVVSHCNAAIHFICAQPDYYDGPVQELVRDESEKTHYNIVGVKFRGMGKTSKIRINILNYVDALSNDADLPIDTSELSELTKRHCDKNISEWREIFKKIDEEIEEERQQDKKRIEEGLISTEDKPDNHNYIAAEKVKAKER